MPVPILLCLPSVPLTPLPFLLLYSSLPSPSVFYLPLKAAEISFEICVCKFSFCCFRCFFFFFALVCLSCRFSSSLHPAGSLCSTACHVSFMFVCLSCDMCHMKYGGYDIRNMSSLNFPQCYCYSSQPQLQPRSALTFPIPFSAPSSSSLPLPFSFSLSFRLLFTLCFAIFAYASEFCNYASNRFPFLSTNFAFHSFGFCAVLLLTFFSVSGTWLVTTTTITTKRENRGT